MIAVKHMGAERAPWPSMIAVKHMGAERAPWPSMIAVRRSYALPPTIASPRSSPMITVRHTRRRACTTASPRSWRPLRSARRGPNQPAHPTTLHAAPRPTGWWPAWLRRQPRLARYSARAGDDAVHRGALAAV